ncbi:MAG: DUF5615 family PIN-like protein [Cyanobacteria bacterium J06621_11]
MKLWIDAQLPPSLAPWISENLGIEAFALRDLNLRDAKDIETFQATRTESAVITTKDSDFIDLVCRLGAPPKIIWLTCGNVTNRNLKKLLQATLHNVIAQLENGETIVEINNAP